MTNCFYISLWLFGLYPIIYLLRKSGLPWRRLCSYTDGLPTPHGKLLVFCFAAWLLGAFIALYLPEQWLESIYIYFRHFLLPTWAISGHLLPGEWYEALPVMRQFMRLVITMALWTFAVKPSYGIFINISFLHYKPYVNWLLWVMGGLCLVHILYPLPSLIGFDPPYTYKIQLPSFQLPWWINIINLLILIPLSDELFFRHWLLRWLSYQLPLGLALITSSLIFTIAHGLPGHGINYGASLALLGLGSWLGSCYLRHKSLWMIVSIHSGYNALTLLLSLYIPK